MSDDTADLKNEIALLRAELETYKSSETDDQPDCVEARFLANMSHEIRTPLNGILGMTELVLETHLTEEQRAYLEIINASGKSLLRIVNDILDFSKADAQALSLNPTAFNVREYLQQIVEVLTVRANRKNIEFVYHVDPDVPQTIVADSVRLGQVLLNLADNAIKFSSEKGGVLVYVDVKSKTENGVVLHIVVSDSGNGIPADKRKMIFESFTQIDSSSTREYGGTGLGLAICSRIVQLMQGEIWVRSKQDVGSAFHFTLCCQLPEEFEDTVEDDYGWQSETGTYIAHNRMTDTGSTKVGDKPLRILVAEDNLLNQKLVTALLEKDGHKVTIACDGKEVIDKVQQGKFDLIFMDCQMPKIDGLEATAAIRKWEQSSGTSIPIVALTAHAFPGDKERCLNAGMDGYLAKPISKSGLRRVLNEFFG